MIEAGIICLTVLIICLTVLIIGWLNSRAHDGKLRLESERMRLAADTKASEREPAAWDAYQLRVTGVERRLERVEKGLEDLSTATALGRRR